MLAVALLFRIMHVLQFDCFRQMKQYRLIKHYKAVWSYPEIKPFVKCVLCSTFILRGLIFADFADGP